MAEMKANFAADNNLTEDNSIAAAGKEPCKSGRTKKAQITSSAPQL
jgi:hypothetical protein